VTPTNEILGQIILLERIAALAKQRAAPLREQLAARAREELERDGTARTWRMPDVVTASTSVTHETVHVADPQAWTRWVEARFPTEVERITVVRPAFQSVFLERHALPERREPSGEWIVVDAGTGEVVPGLGVRPGGEFGGVSIRVTSAAKAAFGALADQGLDRLALGANVPIVLAEVEASDA
jgi:hypothetical protein